MKKKLAMLLASIMIMAVPAQVLAAASNRIDWTAHPVTSGTVAFEHGVWTGSTSEITSFVDNKGVSYAIDGQDLVITLDNNIPVYSDTSFEIVLDGAKWFFRSPSTTIVGQVGTTILGNGSDLSNLKPNNTKGSINIERNWDASSTAFIDTTGTIATGSAIRVGVNVSGVDKTEYSAVPDTDFNDARYKGNPLGKTYDTANGVFVPESGAANGSGYGTYYRFQKPTNNNLFTHRLTGVINFSDAVGYDSTEGWYYKNTRSGVMAFEYSVASSFTPVTVGGVDYAQNDDWAAYDDSATDTATVRAAVDAALARGLARDFAVRLTDESATYQIPYRIDISSASAGATRAKLTVLPIRDEKGNVVLSTYVGGSGQSYQIRIPLVYKATANEVKVSIPAGTSFVGGVSLSPTVLGVPETGRTVTISSLSPDKSGRDRIALGEISIKENIGAVIQNGGVIQLKAPAGFKFDNTLSSIKLGVEHNIYWDNNGSAITSVAGTQGANYLAVFKKNNYTQTYDYSTIYLYVPAGNLQQSVPNSPGRLWIRDLVLVADYDAPFGEVQLTVSTFDKPADKIQDEATVNLVNSLRTGTGLFTDLMGLSDISRTNIGIGDPVTFKVGTRADWKLTFEATMDPVPELVSGRYEPVTNDLGLTIDISQRNAGVLEHGASPVRLTELATSAWWAARETTFTLPEGVKFRKVELQAKSNIDMPANGTVIIADGNRTATYCLEAQRFSLYNLTITANSTASITFRPFISIAANFEGPVELTFDNNTVSDVTNQGPMKAIIATAIKPVSVVVESIQTLQIGYQTLDTGNITITETKAGVLQRGKEIKVSVTDRITQDLYFAPVDASKVNVTKGAPTFAIRDIKNLDVNNNFTTNGGYSLLGINSGTISMTVDRASSNDVPAEIVLSNLQVKVSRDVPQSTVDYDVVVWGSAIAANYGTARDMHNVPGISEKYVSVTSSAKDIAVLTDEVRLTIGQSYYLRNGLSEDFDTSGTPYISASGATMVPLRFVAMAFGIKASEILYDDSTKTATIIHPSRIIQFTAGSDRMVLNGAPVTMDYSSIGAGFYKAEIKDDRMFIPFRPLGDAFGVAVDWEAETQTAIYNKIQ